MSRIGKIWITLSAAKTIDGVDRAIGDNVEVEEILGHKYIADGDAALYSDEGEVAANIVLIKDRVGAVDSEENPIGANDADNGFDSSLVTANSDGSVLERLEQIQTLVAAVTAGQVVLQGAADAGTNSTTVIPIAGLSGYGNDFFNNQFYLQVLCNKNSAGNAPEKSTKKITDYVSATGTFTCDAFGAAVEATDLCLILHESQVAIGSDNANNVFDSSNVAANPTGSTLERLQDLKERIDIIDDYADTEIAAIKAVTDALPSAGALTTLSDKLDTIDNFIDGANLEKLSGATDGGTHSYPDSIVQDSMLAYMLVKGDPAVITAYNNTTDSQQAISDKIGTPAGADISTDIAAVKTEVDKIGVPVGASVSADVAAISTLIGTPAADLAADIAAIKLQTDELGAAAGASISADIAAVQAEVDKLGTPAADLAADIAAIKLQTDEIGAAVGASISADIAAVQAEVDKLGTPAGADVSADILAIKTETALIKTEVDKLGTPAGADVSADIAAVKTEVDKLGTPAGADVSADIAAIKAAVDAKVLPLVVRKTVTFANTAVDVNLFDITGAVDYQLKAFCTTNVESAAGCNIGVDHNGAIIIADTDCTILEANDIWHDATPDASTELESVFAKRSAYGGTITIDVEAAKQVDSGVIVFVLIYTPVTADGAAVVAA